MGQNLVVGGTQTFLRTGIMALAGISARGSRFLTFLQPGLMMNSKEYSKMMNFTLKKIAKKNNMIIYNRSKVHTAKKQFFFQEPPAEVIPPPWKVTGST